MDLNIGDKIKFIGESKKYTIRAISDKFIICTKPFNARNTTLYTVVDLDNNIRGTENLIFPNGAETDEQCNEMLKRLDEAKTEISHRNFVELKIEQLIQSINLN